MTLHQTAPTKAHLCDWEGRAGGGAAKSCCRGAWPGAGVSHMRMSSIICCLKLEKPCQSFFQQDKGPPPRARRQWCPRQSTKTAGTQGSGCTEPPRAAPRDHAPIERRRKEHTQLLKPPTRSSFCSRGPCHPSLKPPCNCRKVPAGAICGARLASPGRGPKQPPGREADQNTKSRASAVKTQGLEALGNHSN